MRASGRRSLSIGTTMSMVVLAGVLLWTGLVGVRARAELGEARDRAIAEADLLADVAASDIDEPDLAQFLSDFTAQLAASGLSPQSCDVWRSLTANTDYGFVIVATRQGVGVCSTFAVDSVDAEKAAAVSYDELDPVRRAMRTATHVGPLPATDPVSGEFALLDVFPVARTTEVIGSVVVFRYAGSLGIEGAVPGRDDVDVVVATEAGEIVGRKLGDGTWVGGRLPARLIDAEGRVADLDGVDRYWGRARVPGVGWTLLAGIDVHSALAPSEADVRRDAAFTAFALLVLLLLTFVVSRRIAHPIRALVATIDHAAAGDRSARAEPRGPREVAHLAREYNAMADVRDQAEATLAERLAFINAVAASLGEGVYATDLDGFVTFVNRAALELTGYSTDELVGRSAHELLHRVPRASSAPTEADCPMCSPLAGSEVRVLEHVLVRADGSLLPVSFTAAPITSPAGAAGVVYTFEDITGRLAFEERLTYQALHDGLTALPNRTLFLDRLRSAIDRSTRSDELVAVLFVDLDRFKLINDTFGHDAGDALLKEMAVRVRDVVRPGDTVSRFGGDEFTVLCEGLAHETEVLLIADRLRTAIASPVEIDGRRLVCTPSIGVAFARPGHTPVEILRDADAAMYRSKERGRDRCEVFDDDMRERMVQRLEIEADLRRALELGGQLTVRYQPIVDAVTGHIAGLEALARWQHPERGEVLPPEFIPIAEETGLIVPLGEQVLDQACRDLARWKADWPDLDPWMAVNVSARQLATPGLLPAIERALAAHGIAPDRLCVEITETVLLDDIESVVETLLAIRRLGVQLSIDDFGTGYSALSYLARYPVQKLKIDRGFVARILHSESDRAVARAVIRLAQALSLEVVAEGVETLEQLEALREDHCDLAQGFLFQAPLRFPEISALLARRAPLGVPART